MNQSDLEMEKLVVTTRERGVLVFYGVMLLMTLAPLAIADALYLYKLHDGYKVPFPGEPSLTMQVGEGKMRLNYYAYEDHANLMVYSSAATQSRMKFKDRDTDDAIENWVRGDVFAADGTLDHLSVGKVNNIRGATYRYSYDLHGLTMLKCGAVIYHNEIFITWAVQGSPGLSTSDPCIVFETYVSNFGPF